MNKEMKIEKTRESNYEILCIMRECSEEQKNVLLEKIKKDANSEITVKSEVKKLAYPVEKIESAEYLLLNFKTDREKISNIEETLKNQLVIRHMTINLDTEKKIKIKNSDRMQRNRRFRKPVSKNERRPQMQTRQETEVAKENEVEINN